MSFGSTSFAEQPFAADSLVFTVDISPVYYFNNKVLTFEMSVNFLSSFDVYYSKDFEVDLNINTSIENQLFR
jgi:hypothetical protein